MKDWNKNWIDLYAVLEIAREASEIEIKQAYREKVKIYHSDNYENKPNKEQEEAKCIFLNIQLAYDTFCNPEEKEIYDSIYDKKKNNKYLNKENVDEDINYEEVINNYSKASRRQAERISLKILIQENLDLAKEYVKQKNDMILDAYTNGIEKQTYFENIVELQTLTYSYINTLKELKMMAYDYDLMESITLIEDTIDKLVKEFEKLPTNIDEVIIYISKEQVRKCMEKDCLELESAYDELSNKMSNLCISCYEKSIPPLQFDIIKHCITNEAQDKINYLQKLVEIATKLELEEKVVKLSSILADLKIRVKYLPNTYQEADLQGKYVLAYKEIGKLNDKIERIISLIKLYPASNLCDTLFEIATKILEQIRKISHECNPEDLSKELSVIEKDIYNMYEDSLALYREIQDRKEVINVQNYNENMDILPTTMLYKAIIKEINIKKMYEFAKEMHLEKSNDNYMSFIEDLKNAIIYSRNVRIDIEINKHTCDNQKSNNQMAEHTCDNQESNNQMAEHTCDNQINEFKDNEKEKTFEDMINIGEIPIIWNEACNPDMWESATWEDFFTGKRREILFDDSQYLPKYINQMRFIFNEVEKMKSTIQVKSENETVFINRLLVASYLLVEYRRLIQPQYGYKDSNMDIAKQLESSNNFGTPFSLAIDKLFRLWFKKRNTFFCEISEYYLSKGIVGKKTSVLMSKIMEIKKIDDINEANKNLLELETDIFLYNKAVYLSSSECEKIRNLINKSTLSFLKLIDDLKLQYNEDVKNKIILDNIIDFNTTYFDLLCCDVFRNYIELIKDEDSLLSIIKFFSHNSFTLFLKHMVYNLLNHRENSSGEFNKTKSKTL